MKDLDLGRYHIAEQIGAGGMGVVYRARDQRLDRDVALKVLPPGSLTDQASRSRFRKEALALSRLTHPNIAVVHDFDTLDDTDFLVMELVPGITLEEKLVAGPLDESEALKLVSVGEFPRNKKLDPAELAAYTAVASLILNLDETITKE